MSAAFAALQSDMARKMEYEVSQATVCVMKQLRSRIKKHPHIAVDGISNNRHKSLLDSSIDLESTDEEEIKEATSEDDNGESDNDEEDIPVWSKPPIHLASHIKFQLLHANENVRKSVKPAQSISLSKIFTPRNQVSVSSQQSRQSQSQLQRKMT